MKRKGYSEEQIIAILKEAEAGATVADVIRKHGIADGHLLPLETKCGSMDVSDAKHLKQMEDENRRLKCLVADQALNIQMLKDVNSKNW